MASVTMRSFLTWECGSGYLFIATATFSSIDYALLGPFAGKWSLDDNIVMVESSSCSRHFHIMSLISSVFQFDSAHAIGVIS